MRTIEDFLTVSRIDTPPETASYQLGKWNSSKGITYALNVFKPIHNCLALEIMPGVAPRGNHFHKDKLEAFFVLTGKVIGEYFLPESPNEVKKIEHSPGDLIVIKPGLGHRYSSEILSWAIEFSAGPFDDKDTCPIPAFSS